MKNYNKHQYYRKTKQRNPNAYQTRMRKRLHSQMLDTIPDAYPALFPLARTMERHFVLHIGPTNSGKTYQAIEKLKKAASGVYLAPLRLLAYEQFEKLNESGYPCSLCTGEERELLEGALYTSSTIEMASLSAEYDIAVIDEGQMVADPERGGAWTQAILGLCAREIHICASADAEELLIRLIGECSDSYQVEYHERNCPLIVEESSCIIPKHVQNGDALIVFSKKAVHAVAAELQARGISTSVIYGALPYDVRHEQARKFTVQESKVLVATDAIGMGLNLPIRRVIFLETEKFDGREVRLLNFSEIRQIAGRAGRYGIYPEGYVSSTSMRKRIRKALTTDSFPLQAAVIGFPESLMDLEAPLGEILRRWDAIPVHQGFQKANMKRLISLCDKISTLSKDKDFLYRCLTITFDERNPTLLRMWEQMCRAEAAETSFPVKRNLPRSRKKAETAEDLDSLEQDFRICDLLYNYCDRFRHDEFIDEILDKKKKISARIILILDKQKLRPRRCRFCGQALSWNYGFSICDSCHNSKLQRHLEDLDFNFS